MKKLFLSLVCFSCLGAFSQSFPPTFIKYNSTGINSRIHPDYIDYDGDGQLDVLGGFEERLDFLLFKNEGPTLSIQVVADSILGYPFIKRFDFNQDGFQDFVAVMKDKSANENVYLCLNDGNYNYSPQKIMNGFGELTNVIPTDIDADGDYDFVVDEDGSSCCLYLIENLGNQNFQQSFINFSGLQSELFGVADMDADGLPDLVTSHVSFSSNLVELEVLETDTTGGSISFITHSVASYGYNRRGIIADFSGNSLTDIIYPNTTTGGDCQLWTNTGNFTFTLQSQPQVERGGTPYLPNDYDADGDMDFIAVGANVGVQLIQNNGNGNFSRSTLISEFGAVPINWEDLNGDGKEDLLFSGRSMVGVYLQGNTPTAAYTKFWANNDNGRSHLRIFDATNNGRLDIITSQNNDISVIKQTFDEKILGAEYYNPTGNPLSFPDFNDLLPMDRDNDGDLDLLASYQNDFFWLVNNNGTFSAASINGTFAGAVNFSLTDFDNDGSQDVVMTANNRLLRAEWNGTSFVSSTIAPTNDRHTLADVDADGDQDVVYLSYDISTVSYDLMVAVYQSNSFTSQTITNLAGIINANFGAEEEALSAGDIDKDGDDDLFLINEGQGKVVLMVNNGNLNFTPLTLTDSMQTPRHVEVGDIDNDGDNDVIISSATQGEVYLFANNGATTFTQSLIGPESTFNLIEDLLLIDFDTDGDLDFITNSQVDDKLIWYKNDLIDCPRVYSQSSTTLCYGDSLLVNGKYYVAPTVVVDTNSSASGCDSISVFSLNAYPPAPPAIFSETICPGDTLFFNGKFYTSAGQYIDTFQTQNGCDSFTILNVNEFSVSNLVIATNTNTLTTSSNFTAYAWYYNGALLANENSFSIDAGQYGAGVYYVTAIDGNGCEVVSDTVNFTPIHVGLSPTPDRSSLRIYPNPARAILMIECDASEIAMIRLFSMDGRLVKEDRAKFSGLISIALEDLSSGTYLVEVIATNASFKKILIVE